ncbi:MAG: helix-turn-helix domain-containing protein [Pseudomonadota bacterium]
MSRSCPAWVAPLLSVILLVLVLVPGARADRSPASCEDKPETGQTINTLPETSEKQLRPMSIAYFVDPTGAWNPAMVVSQPFITDSCLERYPVPEPGGSLWLRFDVHNPHEGAGNWFVGFRRSYLDEVVLYEYESGALRLVSQNGRAVEPDQKSSDLFNTGIPFQIEAKTRKTYYLQVSGAFPPVVTPVLASGDRFDAWSQTYQTLSMLVLGFVGMMAVVSLIVFRHVDPQFYQFYTLYMVSRFAFTFINDGWLPQVFGLPLSGTVSTPLMHLFAGLGPFSIILFCRVLLSKDDYSKFQQWTFRLLLTGAVAVTALAMLRPWTMYVPLHLFVVITPFVLFPIAFSKHRSGITHAKWVCAGLATLMCGLSVAMYAYMFQANLLAPTSVLDLIAMRPLILGYFFAIFAEPVFMMIAISAMMAAKNRAAVMQLASLRQDVMTAEQQRAEVNKNASARIERLEATLADSTAKNLLPPIEQRFMDRATDCALKHVAEEGFGARELASALGVSEKTLGRRLKQVQGLSPAAFIRSVRLNNARNLILLRQHSTVAEIAHAAGFASVSHFAKLYRQQFSETPSETFKLLKAAAE